MPGPAPSSPGAQAADGNHRVTARPGKRAADPGGSDASRGEATGRAAVGDRARRSARPVPRGPAALALRGSRCWSPPARLVGRVTTAQAAPHGRPTASSSSGNTGSPRTGQSALGPIIAPPPNGSGGGGQNPPGAAPFQSLTNATPGIPAIGVSQPTGDGDTVFIIRGQWWPVGKPVIVTLVGVGVSSVHPIADHDGSVQLRGQPGSRVLRRRAAGWHLHAPRIRRRWRDRDGQVRGDVTAARSRTCVHHKSSCREHQAGSWIRSRSAGVMIPVSMSAATATSSDSRTPGRTMPRSSSLRRRTLTCSPTRAESRSRKAGSVSKHVQFVMRVGDLEGSASRSRASVAAVSREPGPPAMGTAPQQRDKEELGVRDRGRRAAASLRRPGGPARQHRAE